MFALNRSLRPGACIVLSSSRQLIAAFRSREINFLGDRSTAALRLEQSPLPHLHVKTAPAGPARRLRAGLRLVPEELLAANLIGVRRGEGDSLSSAILFSLFRICSRRLAKAVLGSQTATSIIRRWINLELGSVSRCRNLSQLAVQTHGSELFASCCA